ncbi:MAG TPA: MASE1 domain-containing protein [Gemmatimonadales bacterium]|nr:MASE1 domain-containing protein [Gemmatimonadales bacterium]
MRARGIPYLLQVLGVGLAYAVGARLGQFTAIPPGNVSALWASAGISVAALALLGLRVWPGVWLGAFTYNFAFFHNGVAIDPSAVLGISVGIATSGTVMAVAGRYIVQLVQGPVPAVDSPRDALLWIFGAGFLAAAISASAGTGILSIGQLLPLPAPVVWRTWWLGDATGVALVAPLAVLWARHGALHFRPGQETETLLAALAFAVICFAVFGTVAPEAATPYLLAVPLLFLGYAAVRFGRRITACTALALAIVASVATASGRGPLRAAEYPGSLLALQAFLVVAATLGLTLACAAARRRTTMDRPVLTDPDPATAFPVTPLSAFRRVPDATAGDHGRTAAPAPLPGSGPAAALDAVLAALPEPVYVLARDSLSVSRCNIAFARALGHADRSTVEGRSIFDIFPPDLALLAADESRRVFRTEEARESREEWPGDAAGLGAFDVSRTPLYDADGVVNALLARARPATPPPARRPGT